MVLAVALRDFWKLSRQRAIHPVREQETGRGDVRRFRRLDAVRRARRRRRDFLPPEDERRRHAALDGYAGPSEERQISPQGHGLRLAILDRKLHLDCDERLNDSATARALRQRMRQNKKRLSLAPVLLQENR